MWTTTLRCQQVLSLVRDDASAKSTTDRTYICDSRPSCKALEPTPGRQHSNSFGLRTELDVHHRWRLTTGSRNRLVERIEYDHWGNLLASRERNDWYHKRCSDASGECNCNGRPYQKRPTGRARLTSRSHQSPVQEYPTWPSVWPSPLSDMTDTLTGNLVVNDKRLDSRVAVARPSA